MNLKCADQSCESGKFCRHFSTACRFLSLYSAKMISLTESAALMRSEITGPPPKFKTLKFLLGAILTKIRDAPHIGIHSAWVLCKNPNSSQRQNNCGNLFHILAPCLQKIWRAGHVKKPPFENRS